ncbi:hypothetical protein [Undibacterium squillarum]|uniref:hypothetical protein n=1 Tax=Undibacterium squillarum TaxID=1131567 RepID=UPI0035AFA387
MTISAWLQRDFNLLFQRQLLKFLTFEKNPPDFYFPYSKFSPSVIFERLACLLLMLHRRKNADFS